MIKNFNKNLEPLRVQAKSVVLEYLVAEGHNKDCFAALYQLIITNGKQWDDEIPAMQSDMENLLVFLTDPDIASRFSQLFPSSNGAGKRLKSLCDFFRNLDGDVCNAEIEDYEIDHYYDAINDDEFLRKISNYKGKLAVAKFKKSLHI